MNGPRCDRCRKKLVWEPTRIERRRTPTRTGRRIRHSVTRYRREWNITAVRCLDCRRVFCPKCARWHFVHTDKVHHAVEKVLVRISMAMLREVEKGAKIRGRLLCEKLTRRT